jgi:Holliday junction resolvasome RuvABC endonuclease subunit
MMDSAGGKIIEEGQPSLIIVDDVPEKISLVAESEPANAAADTATELQQALASIKAKPARGRTAAPAPEADVPAEPEAIDAPAAEPAPAPVAADAQTDEPEEHAKPARKKLALQGMIPVAALSLAVLASTISAVGTVVASRMVARTNTVLESVEAHQSKMRRLDSLIEEVDGLRQREQLALVRIEQVNAGKPASSLELRSAIGGLQLAISRSQSGTSAAALNTIRDGQAELAERMSTIYRKIDRIDKQTGQDVSSSPKAHRAGDPKPIS